MKTAIEYLTDFYDNKKSVDYYLPDTSMCLKHLKASQSMDRDYYLDGMVSVYKRNPQATPTKGFIERFAKHKSSTLICIPLIYILINRSCKYFSFSF